MSLNATTKETPNAYGAPTHAATTIAQEAPGTLPLCPIWSQSLLEERTRVRMMHHDHERPRVAAAGRGQSRREAAAAPIRRLVADVRILLTESLAYGWRL